jgi:hypothetical protein
VACRILHYWSAETPDHKAVVSVQISMRRTKAGVPIRRAATNTMISSSGPLEFSGLRRG